jgi:hypothetical protein
MNKLEDQYRGMSMKDRLFSAGLLNDFDKEVGSGNRKKMIELLGRVGLASQSVWIADSILSHPTKAGWIGFGR